MESKRKLIKEDKQLLQDLCNDLKGYKPLLANFKRAYEDLEIGTLTKESFKIIVLTGSSNTVKFYITTLENQLKKLGVTSKLLRDNLLENHKGIIETFENSLKDLKKFKPENFGDVRPLLNIRHFSFDEVQNSFVITKDDKEELLELFCRTYLETEDLPILEKIEELKTIFNDFLDIVASQKIVNHDPIKSLYLIFDIKNSKAEINPDKLKSLITHKSRYLNQFQKE